jgi:hypothetical protein
MKTKEIAHRYLWKCNIFLYQGTEEKEYSFFQIYVNCFKAIFNLQHITNIHMSLAQVRITYVK